ncbi:hypothetical protein AB0425_06800 [Actinosynnema sp. NPDC051121]|nr:hypothetical protein [Saccharothrix sp.]
MSGDFSEPDRRGLAEWLDAWGAVPDRRDVPDQRGGSAYVVSFGWLPSRLPPSAQGVESVLPRPRRAIEDQPRWDEPR